jgi:hypothetical protein
MSLSLIYVNLATLAVGSLFYGIYSVLFSMSIYLFIRRHNSECTSPESRKHNSIFKSMVFLSAILLFVVVTTVRPSPAVRSLYIAADWMWIGASIGQ